VKKLNSNRRPVKAGVQEFCNVKKLDSGFRRNDKLKTRLGFFTPPGAKGGIPGLLLPTRLRFINEPHSFKEA
jgi:hypothetical protein